MNILVAVSHKYREPLKNMLYSLCCNAKGKHTIYCPYCNLTKKDIKELQTFVSKKCGSEFVPITLGDDFLKGAYVYGRFTIEMYYRIFASKLVPAELDRILWLDADLIVNKDITEFYEQDFQGKSLAVCRDQHQMYWSSRKKELGLPEDVEYFNSGVILFNLAKIRKNFDEEKVICLIQEKKDALTLLDQDILNVLYCRDVIYAPDEMNYQFYQYWEKRYGKVAHLDRRNKDAAIIHFVGGFKPWNFLYRFNEMGNYYWKYQWKRKKYFYCIFMSTIHVVLDYIKPVKDFLDPKKHKRS